MLYQLSYAGTGRDVTSNCSEPLLLQTQIIGQGFGGVAEGDFKAIQSK